MPTPSLAALPIRRLTRRDLKVCADLSEDRGWPREEHKWGFLLTAGTGYGIDDPPREGWWPPAWSPSTDRRSARNSQPWAWCWSPSGTLARASGAG
ncbi:hypothetical protein GCM10020295_42130 [Streptomyces cinereospinus]